MKDSDLQNARRVLHLIRLLTAEHQTAVAIICDDPYGPPDCTITTSHPRGTGVFNGDSILDCLLQAMKARGLEETADWAGDPLQIVPDLVAAVEVAKGDIGLRFEAAPGKSLFGNPPTIEDELTEAMGFGSPVQDLRGEYAAAYHRAHLEAIREVGHCEGCGITAEELKEQGGELNTHHAISVERIFNEGLDPSLVGDRKNLVVVCRNGGDECHFLIGHDDDGPGGRGPSWARSNKHVRRDLAAHLEHKKHARQAAEYFMDPDGDGDDIP